MAFNLDNFWRSESGRRIIFIFRDNHRLNLAMVLYDFPHSKQGHRGLVSLSQRVKPHRLIVLTWDYFQYKKEGQTTFIYLPATMTWLLPEIMQI